jgi:hypothetical protein
MSLNFRASLLGKSEGKKEKHRGLENMYLRITVNKSRRMRQQNYTALGENETLTQNKNRKISRISFRRNRIFVVFFLVTIQLPIPFNDTFST